MRATSRSGFACAPVGTVYCTVTVCAAVTADASVSVTVVASTATGVVFESATGEPSTLTANALAAGTEPVSRSSLPFIASEAPSTVAAPNVGAARSTPSGRLSGRASV